MIDLAYYEILARESYNVSPKIFVFLMIVTTPFFYLGLYLIGKSLIIKEDKKISNHKFLIGLTIHVIAWFLPYFYVIFFSNNLPKNFWIFLAVYLTVFGFLAFKKIYKKINKHLS